jgi:hypothetical protein
MIRLVSACLVVLGLSRCVFADKPNSGETSQTDQAILIRFLGSADSDRLLNFLRSQKVDDSMRKQIAALIEQLGSPAFRQRQEAQGKLLAMGPVVVPFLRDALSHTDQEIAGRARRCLQELQRGPRAGLPAATIRVLAQRRDARLVPILLEIGPSSPDDPWHSLIVDTLTELARHHAESRQLIRQALASSSQRALAVFALIKALPAAELQDLDRFLDDADPTVRFPVAMLRIQHHDRRAIPALISVIRESPSTILWQQAEEALYAAAGEHAPAVVVKSGTTDGRRAIADQWENWWKTKGNELVLGKAEDYPTDICVVAETGLRNRVYEWRAEGKSRFHIKDLISPVDARVLPGNRVLIAEQSGRRVSERSFGGQVLWQKILDDEPVSVMRLANGNTFVATLSRILEIRRDGDIARSLSLPDASLSISDANQLSDGRIAVITMEDELLYLSSTGEEIARAKLDSPGAIEALPNGHVLVSQNARGRIAEFDAQYKAVANFQIEGAWMATRLPDQNYLVACKMLGKMLKVDREGKVLAEYKIDGQPHAIHWR